MLYGKIYFDVIDGQETVVFTSLSSDEEYRSKGFICGRHAICMEANGTESTWPISTRTACGHLQPYSRKNNNAKETLQ